MERVNEFGGRKNLQKGSSSIDHDFDGEFSYFFWFLDILRCFVEILDWVFLVDNLLFEFLNVRTEERKIFLVVFPLPVDEMYSSWFLENNSTLLQLLLVVMAAAAAFYDSFHKLQVQSHINTLLLLLLLFTAMQVVGDSRIYDFSYYWSKIVK